MESQHSNLPSQKIPSATVKVINFSMSQNKL